MIYIEFEGYNLLLQPPSDAPRGTVGALPVFRDDSRMCSVWKLSAEDLAALNAGAHVCLTVVGSTHPPVSLHVQKFEEMP